MPSVHEIIKTILNEAKAALKEFLQETETNAKQQLKKLLIISIISSILLAVAISFLGSASLFLLVGSLKYMKMFVPAWLAWIIMGITAIIIAIVLIIVLYLIIRKQLSSPSADDKQEGNQQEAADKTATITSNTAPIIQEPTSNS
ncbi:MAG: hypothetical protein NWF01_08580 [Candidatus Bathyarchaeota archaeon]|nr:hypothetical protein [Candidatus Bathyarchaeota archaeon]